MVIFLISTLFSPKSLVLTPQSAMPSFLYLYLSMISGHITLFYMLTLVGTIRSYVSGWYFHVFSDCFWIMFPQIFWNWDINVFADVPADYIINSVVSFFLKLVSFFRLFPIVFNIVLCLLGRWRNFIVKVGLYSVALSVDG